MTEAVLKRKYLHVKEACAADAKDDKTGQGIFDIAKMSLSFLTEKCRIVKLVSRVPGKKYFTFSKNGVIARPANEALFIMESGTLKELWKHWLAKTITPGDFTKLSYTVALAPCLAMEIFNRQNKKGPATYFECYIGYLFSRALKINPTKKAQLVVRGRKVSLTMDFLFDLDVAKVKVHLPVKMSTRERVVQAWAHQRLLDSAYGVGSYKGIMVLFSETKLDSRTHEVVEICVPDQWLTYQELLAKMDRIYYFDPPERYLALTRSYPDIIVIKQFGEYFKEEKSVIYS